jgi:hypothetical protein
MAEPPKDMAQNILWATLLSALYKNILGRTPEPGECDLWQEFTPENAQLQLQAFLESLHRNAGFPERFWRQAVEVAGRSTVAAPSETVPPIHEVFSLGTFCFTAGLLKNASWVRGRSPFDWIFSSSPMVRHVLEDDFRVFLDKTLYRPVPLAERASPDVNKCDHMFYRETYGVKFVFNHVNAAGADYEFINDSVQQFRAAMRSENEKMLVQCAHWSPDFADEFHRMADCVSRTCRNAVLVSFIVAEPSKSAVPQLEMAGSTGRHQLHVLRPVSRWLPLRFQDAIDEIALIRTLKCLNLQPKMFEPRG